MYWKIWRMLTSFAVRSNAPQGGFLAKLRFSFGEWETSFRKSVVEPKANPNIWTKPIRLRHNEPYKNLTLLKLLK